MLPEPTTTLELPDGRQLACDDVGALPGEATSVVLYLHGAPDCRLARHPDDGVAAAAGIRLVAVDRPGYGWSDPPAPDLLTFGDELGLLLDHLDVERCTVAAWSAGAPWAFGAAAALGSERVDRVVTYGAVAPFEALIGRDEDVAEASGDRVALARSVVDGDVGPDELATDMAMLLVPSPPVPVELARDQVLESLSPAVAAELLAAGLVEVLAWSLAAAVDRHADAGLRCDVVAQFRPGVEALLDRITCPVVLVHGERDRVAGPGVGRWLAARLADAHVEVWEGAGHQGLLLGWSRWLGVVTGRR